MARDAVRRRTRSLAVLEAANVLLLPVALLVLLEMPASAGNVAGLALTLTILVEGSAYWALKYRQLTRRDRAPAGLGIFRWLGRLNVVALGVGLIIVIAGVVASPGTRSWPGLALWAFAVAEHVNYFHVQLMHDTRADITRLLRNRRLRTASLARDLARDA